MSEDFVSLGSLKVNHVDETYNDAELGDCIDIYQFQPKMNSQYATIINIGEMHSAHDVLIKEFDINNFGCYMISKLYDIDNLKLMEESCRFHLIQLLICHKNNPIACIYYNFNTFDHIKNKKSIIDFISNQDKQIDLYGFYSITFHFKENNVDKYTTIKIEKLFPGNTQMMMDMTHCVTENEIQNILKKII